MNIIDDSIGMNTIILTEFTILIRPFQQRGVRYGTRHT